MTVNAFVYIFELNTLLFFGQIICKELQGVGFVKEEQLKLFDEITQKQEKISQSLLEYWQLYSNFGTWQYWLMASLVIFSLDCIVLLDR